LGIVRTEAMVFFEYCFCMFQDKDKEQLLSMCGPEIEKRQVDNWFINSRKRQWFKLFTHGDVPTTEDAARQELLNIYKSEEEVVVVMQKAWNFG